ncbi:helix-turn-helix family protein (plasmid) [Burkholderia gladioli]|nr:helix-turn-helix family protein [Burkholderia gladioli]
MAFERLAMHALGHERICQNPNFRAQPDHPQAVGRRLKEVRLQAGKSQEDLAHEAAVSRVAISAVESGAANTTVLTLAALCRPLGISLSELFAPLTMPLDAQEPRRVNAAKPPKIGRSRLR